jgi:phosphoenolpyruvate carboxykinase (ATP)
LKSEYGLENHGFSGTGLVYWNLPTEALVEEMLFRGEAKMSRHGPIVATTGKHTGRSASDKFVVREAARKSISGGGNTIGLSAPINSMSCMRA